MADRISLNITMPSYQEVTMPGWTSWLVDTPVGKVGEQEPPDHKKALNVLDKFLN